MVPNTAATTRANKRGHRGAGCSGCSCCVVVDIGVVTILDLDSNSDSFKMLFGVGDDDDDGRDGDDGGGAGVLIANTIVERLPKGVHEGQAGIPVERGRRLTVLDLDNLTLITALEMKDTNLSDSFVMVFIVVRLGIRSGWCGKLEEAFKL